MVDQLEIDFDEPARLEPGCGVSKSVHVRRGFRANWPDWKPKGKKL